MAVLAAWQNLADQAIEPNGMNRPELILSLLHAVGGAELALVQRGGQLEAALAVTYMGAVRGCYSNWVTPLCMIGTPYLAKPQAPASFATFLEKFNAPLLLQSIPMQGPFYTLAQQLSSQFQVTRQWQRAVLKPEGRSYESWLAENFERKRRKEYKRLENRLAEQGEFSKEAWAPHQPLDKWVNDLLRLESAGWKGKSNTDIASNSALSRALHQACNDLAQAGKLRFWRFTLAGKTIASLFAIIDGNQAWLGKIAYDEEYARYSPGVLLILFTTEHLLAEKNLLMIDSCAIPNHPMINNIWRDRIEVADILLAHNNISRMKFNAVLVCEKLRRKTRSIAREVYYFVMKGKHRS